MFVHFYVFDLGKAEESKFRPSFTNLSLTLVWRSDLNLGSPRT